MRVAVRCSNTYVKARMCGDAVAVEEPVIAAVRPEVSSSYHDCNL